MSRLKRLDPNKMEGEQKRVYEEIASGGRGGLQGPYNALLRVPEIADSAQKLGAYCRFHASLGPRLTELAIIITAKHYRAQFEWHAHAELALKAGLDPTIVDAIREGRRPQFAEDKEEAVYIFCTMLHEQHRIDATTYDRTREIFGEKGIVEMTSTVGYYSLISLVLNTFEVPVPEGAAQPFPN
jgi:4-carboxymuconolactone decarboxylase